ncbi:MAG TPA: hypothetical protein PLP19_16910 [bacterium]|nr:hypothetical protein [bacterium]HPN45175.1 hypothetical protein [bacterium]
MSTLFEDIKNGIRDGIELVVDKTEEYGKIGKLKVDIMGIQRNIEKLFAELGGQTFELLSKDDKADVGNDAQVKKMIADLQAQEVKLDSKKNEIIQVREQKEAERREREQNRKQPEPRAASEQKQTGKSSVRSGANSDDIEDANIIEDK